MTNMLMTVGLDRDSEEPIYRQLIRHVRAQIESGSLPAGTRLPASRDLAQQLNISRISVVNAYAELRAEGYLSAHAGRGTFVAGERTGNGNGASTANGNGHRHQMWRRSRSSPRRTPHRLAIARCARLMRLARKPGIINFSHGVAPVGFLPGPRAASTRWT